MILTIDIGNSNILLGCMEEGTIRQVARLATEGERTADQYAVDIRNVLGLYGVEPGEIGGSIIASVVPQVLHSVRSAIALLTGKNPLVVGPGIKTGLNILIDSPASMGSDLIAVAVAGIREYPLPLILFDMGTATTIGVVDEKGSYLGGCVCPGVAISADALSRHAAQLPGISLERPRHVVGRSTVECMRSGIINGHAAMMDGMIQRIQEELSAPATVVATGGIASAILPACRSQIIYDEHLVLKGLWYLYQKNTAGRER
jgi:type III pantothenate kinase